MPIYEYQCSACKKIIDAFRKVEDRNFAPVHCHQLAEKIVSAPAVMADIPSYQSPIDGRWIDGKAQRREDLKRNGCRPWEGLENEKKAAHQFLRDDEKKADEKLIKSIHDTLNNMPAEAQRALTGE